jgi:hypothetical protein
MKLLISSKTLATGLSKIDLSITKVELSGDELLLWSGSDYIQVRIGYRISEHGQSLYQNGVRWDWVKRLVDKVDEQPIILDISERSVNIIFQY